MLLEDLLEKSKNSGWNGLKLFRLLLKIMIICYNVVNMEQMWAEISMLHY